MSSELERLTRAVLDEVPLGRRPEVLRLLSALRRLPVDVWEKARLTTGGPPGPDGLYPSDPLLARSVRPMMVTEVDHRGARDVPCDGKDGNPPLCTCNARQAFRPEDERHANDCAVMRWYRVKPSGAPTIATFASDEMMLAGNKCVHQPMPLMLNAETAADLEQQFNAAAAHASDTATHRLEAVLYALTKHVALERVARSFSRVTREHQTMGASGMPTDVVLLDGIPVWSGTWKHDSIPRNAFSADQRPVPTLVWTEDFTDAWPADLAKP